MRPVQHQRTFPHGHRSVLLAILTCCIVVDTVHAQYFKPFHAGSKKLYAQPIVPTDGFSLAFDSAMADGNDSIHFHFGAFNDTSTYLDPLCTGWGSPYCYRAELPLWSGSLFRTDNAGTYLFRTLSGDTLRFNFNTAIGDTATFHEDAIQRFSFVKSGPDTMTVLGYTDSVYTYIISHTDLDSLPIASALDQHAIIIGKELGLIRFFRVDSFPFVLEPLDLIGNKGPDLGFHRITSASVHDYQPGDIVQYRTYSGNILPFGQPFDYTKHTILSRTDTPDSVIYDVASEYFNINSTNSTTGTSVLKYSKNAVLAELPFERFDGALVTLRYSATPSCALPLWRLGRDVQTALGPCGTGGCWIATDTQGPPPTSFQTTTLGVGTGHSFYQETYSVPFSTYYFDIKSHVYFKKNGVECGTEIHVGFEGIQRPRPISVVPDPTSGPVTITASQVIGTVEIVDHFGRSMLCVRPHAFQLDLDLSALAPGMYHARILLHDGSTSHHALMVVR